MKIYGYYYCDRGFAYRVAERLLQLGRKDTIREYNQWLAEYQEQENAKLKEVAQWYVKQVDDWYESEVRKCKKQQLIERKSMSTQKKHLMNILTWKA